MQLPENNNILLGMACEVLEELSDKFNELATTETDPDNPRPLYVSRMSFSQWKDKLTKALTLMQYMKGTTDAT